MSFVNDNDLIKSITSNIVTLNNNAQRLEDYVGKIGTSEENDRLKEFVNDLIHESNSLSGKTNNMMKQLNILAKNNKEHRINKERLMNEYFAILKRLQDVQRTAVQKEKEKIKTVSVQDHLLSNQSPPEQDSVRLQLQQQHKQNLLELRERQQALVSFESDIQQLNDIFTDLARIVHEQGDMVDSIEANVEHATIYVDEGSGNVRQALEYERKARQKKIQMSNILARSIVQDILHQSLLKDVSLNSSRRRSSESSSSTIVSSASSDSFFKDPGPIPNPRPNLDPDLPNNDRIFSAEAKSKNVSKKPKKFVEDKNNLWLDWDSPPSPTLRLIKDIKKNDLSRTNSGRRRNAVVNQLQKSVTFPKIELIRWPQANFFNQELGREKIIEMIEKTWNYSPLLTYTVYFVSVTGHLSSQRYRYISRWISPNSNVAHVYFNIDVPRRDIERIVTVTYTFENGKIIHKPHTSNYHSRWLREFVQS
ncbi:hypothetical protein FO519_001600 [Halicephalobus sp. NKZ332]|nr:hypothetical protein FO519_001600 [Halicephalobus sp. NKZ332]